MKYLIIKGEASEEITSNDMYIEDFLDDGEVADYMEDVWDRDCTPPLLIPVSEIKKVLDKYKVKMV